MPAPIATNLPAIMAAVEQRLLTFTSVITGAPACQDLSNIYWVFRGQEPVPGTTGQQDVLLIEHPDDTQENPVGAGRLTWIASGLDVNLRSTLASDPRSTYKAFKTAHRLLVDGLLDALMGFFPQDGQQNALTIYGLVPTTNTAPDKQRESLTWGESICSFKFHYLPQINVSILG